MAYALTGHLEPVDKSIGNRWALRALRRDLTELGTDVKCERKDGVVTFSCRVQDMQRAQLVFEQAWQRFKGLKTIHSDLK